MLQIQKFLLTHPDNWKDILSQAPYGFRIVEKWGLVLFKYSLSNSDFNDPICREARGLILEKGSWRVVRKAFDKFFNIGEEYCDEIDWNTASATKKEDGTLISLYYYNEKWNIATNNNIDAHDAPMNNGKYKNFYELAMAAFELYDLDFTILNKNYTYTFELVSPFNRIVVKYDELALFHILTINNITLEEINTSIGIPKPECYQLNGGLNVYKELVDNLGDNVEGLVVKDGSGHRAKLKTLKYFENHRLWNNGTPRLIDIIQIVRDHEENEIIAYFPHFKDYIYNVKSKLEQTDRLIGSIIEEVEPIRGMDRYEFVRKYKNDPNIDLYMKAYDGWLRKFVNDMEINKFARRFDLK